MEKQNPSSKLICSSGKRSCKQPSKSHTSYLTNLETRKSAISVLFRLIGQRLAETCIRLEKLARRKQQTSQYLGMQKIGVQGKISSSIKVAKRRSILNESPRELEALTFEIKMAINDSKADILRLKNVTTRSLVSLIWQTY